MRGIKKRSFGSFRKIFIAIKVYYDTYVEEIVISLKIEIVTLHNF